jgi:hypothetical protein
MKTDADACAGVKTAKPFQRKLISRSDVKARSAVLKLKKRHVECLTRLPTERLATACWAFIVVKTIGLKAAPVLVFGPLRCANMESCQQDIHRSVRLLEGSGKGHRVLPIPPVKKDAIALILAAVRCNRDQTRIEVKGH